MSAKRKKVGTIKHEVSGIELDFYIEGTQFVCDVLERTINAPDASILRKQVLDFIDHWIKLEWHPVIEVEIETGYHDNSVGVSYERFYISIGPAGGTAKVDWDVDENHRRAQARWNRESEWKLVDWPLQAPLKQGNDKWLLPYSDETWQALESIDGGIKAIRNALRQVVSTRAGVERLKLGGSKVLLIGGGK